MGGRQGAGTRWVRGQNGGLCHKGGRGRRVNGVSSI